MTHEDDERAVLQAGEQVGEFVLQTGCDLEWAASCVGVRDGLTVELRFFRLRGSNDDRAAMRFERECGLLLRALNDLQHPHIRRLHGVGSLAGFGWLALERLDTPMLPGSGQPLGPWQRVRERMRDVGAAVIAMEEIGVFPDFEPDDIFLDADGRVRVDCASTAARVRSSFEADDPDTSAAVSGWPSPYRAPEHFEYSYVTPRAHQFVFCMIYWQALFGVLPFPGRSFIEVANAIIKGDRSAPPTGSDVPHWLVRALERGLATDPQARWPSMRELLKVIDRGDGWLGWLRRL